MKQVFVIQDGAQFYIYPNREAVISDCIPSVQSAPYTVIDYVEAVRARAWFIDVVCTPLKVEPIFS